MRTLTAFKLVRMVQGEHRTEAEFDGTGAEGGQEITLILNNIDAQDVDLHVGERYTLDIQRFYPEERISAMKSTCDSAMAGPGQSVVPLSLRPCLSGPFMAGA